LIDLVLGGARSGKSRFAEDLARGGGGQVVYVATALVGDELDLAARVEAHRRRRPPGWLTAEVGAGLLAYLRHAEGAGEGTTLLVDSLGTWVAATPGFGADGPALAAALAATGARCVVVSDEVGLAVHPSTEAGRRFRDALGRVNEAVSAAADRAFLVVAGRALELPPYGNPPLSALP
jgi:adenosylcobinamide kinase/adenosylcobinamide-phosphate guanylyltransferase